MSADRHLDQGWSTPEIPLSVDNVDSALGASIDLTSTLSEITRALAAVINTSDSPIARERPAGRGRGGARTSAPHFGEPLGADGYFLRPAPSHSART